MSEQKYDLEERLLEYSVRIINLSNYCQIREQEIMSQDN